MSNNLTPNFEPINIVNTINDLTKSGLQQVELASAGNDWKSVVEPLDCIEHQLGRSISINM
jgi:hypothetical protein